MSKNRNDLVLRALKDLGVLPQGQTASDEEYDSVDDHVTPMLEDLSARDIYFIPDENQIEDAAFLALGRCLAWACASEFGLGSDAALASLAQQAEVQLQKISATRPTYAVLKTVFF